MNRKLSCLSLVVLLGAACAPPAWGASTLSLVSDTDLFSLPYTGPAFDITAEGNLDWVVVNKNQKDGSDVIACAPGYSFFEASNYLFEYAPNGMPDWAPAYFYTDGLGDTSATYQRADIIIFGGGTHIALPAGSGTISFWWTWAQTDAADAHFSATFDDGTAYTYPDGFNTVSPRKSVISWQTDTAQTLYYAFDYPSGVYAMAVSQVPEPSTLSLLACGLSGLMAYAWRKRK